MGINFEEFACPLDIAFEGENESKVDLNIFFGLRNWVMLFSEKENNERRIDLSREDQGFAYGKLSFLILVSLF